MASPLASGRCLRCGFDADDWNEEDSRNTLRQASSFIELWGDGFAPVQTPPSDAAAGAQAVHTLWHHLDDLYRLTLTSGPAPVEQRGSVQQLNASDGGVPKLAVDSAEVGWRGLVGDSQAARRHHGRPWQALCLWSGDVIDALGAEGHPISAGATGENVTIRGIDWTAIRAGLMVHIGPVRVRLSAPAVPCTKNNRWFADGDSRRIDHDRHPGWSRWYASVLQPGRIETGAPVLISST